MQGVETTSILGYSRIVGRLERKGIRTVSDHYNIIQGKLRERKGLDVVAKGDCFRGGLMEQSGGVGVSGRRKRGMSGKEGVFVKTSLYTYNI